VKWAAAVSGTALLLLYLATLAPDVALWDAGEFSAAAAVYGIPHPPGTPLYVTVGRAWTAALPWLSPAVAMNLLSAVSSAAAFALLGALLARRLGSARWGIAAAICAGTFFTAWRSSLEAEVYAPALLLAVAILWSAHFAGEASTLRRHRNGTALTAYLIVLAVPLHLTALLAVPAAMVLASRVSRSGLAAAAVVGGAGALAAGVAMPSAAVATAGMLAILVGGWRLRPPTQVGDGPGMRRDLASAGPGKHGLASAGQGQADVHPSRTSGALVPVFTASLALTALLVLPLRAAHDPPLNQGAPATLEALADVVQRRQYAVAPLWPRQAPAWLQLGNLVQYADFQVAMSLGRGPVPTPARIAVTLLFAATAVLGARSHLRRDRVGYYAVLLLILGGGPAAVAQLNLKAGPSYGHGVLHEEAPREARERDYFFLLAFAGWGVWAGMGAVALAERVLPQPLRTACLALPALPAVLNFTSASARGGAEAHVARDVAESLLESAPDNAVLLTAGDNDTYPLWYAQMAEGRRTDVLVLPLPMLPATWFRDELERRAGLSSLAQRDDDGVSYLIREIGALGRPVAASPLLRSLPDPVSRGDGWRWRGVVRVFDPYSSIAALPDSSLTKLRARMKRHASEVIGTAASGSPLDPAPRTMSRMLVCAAVEGGAWSPAGDTGLLARDCAVR
jgi:hypothetical protein